MSSVSTSSLQNKIALVTGASSGIGRATALALARQGIRVAVAARREKEGKETVDQIRAAGGVAVFIKADVSHEAEVAGAVTTTLESLGGLDFAVNNAGTEGRFGPPLTEQTEEHYRQVFDTNVKGVLFSMKHELKAMLQLGGGGAIVNVASIAGSIGFPTASVYTASKHAVIGLTKTAALEFASHGIRINSVSPGAIQTDMADRSLGGAGENDVKRYVAGMHPLGRLGTPEEIAAAIVFLVSPGASFITGMDLLADGGYTAK